MSRPPSQPVCEPEQIAPPKYPFLSPGYLAAFHGYLVAKTDEFVGMLESRDFILCETYTGVPPAVNNSAHVSIVWGFEKGRLVFGSDDREDVTIRVRATWAAAEPLARIVFSEDPDASERLQAILSRGAEEHTFSVMYNGEPPPFAGVVQDDLARLTCPPVQAGLTSDSTDERSVK